MPGGLKTGDKIVRRLVLRLDYNLFIPVSIINYALNSEYTNFMIEKI
jgi:hypothetical protein